MKKINIDINKYVKIPNAYTDDLKIVRLRDGYYISCDNTQAGPFLQVFTDKYKQFDNDVFIYGWTPTKTRIYRNGVHGLEETDEIDTTTELVESIQKYAPKAFLPSYEGCKFLGYANVYKLEDREDKTWAKDDGLTRILIPNSQRIIYRTPENQIFAVNSDKPKDYSAYKKFDSFEELCIAVRRNGFDYSYDDRNTKVNNPYIASLVRKLERVGVSDRDIQNTLDQIKNIIGLETYKTLDFTIPAIAKKHVLIDKEELLESLQHIDYNDLQKFIENATTFDSYPRIVIDYINNQIIPNLSSTVKYADLNVTHNNKQFYYHYPNDEKVKSAIFNPNLYDWSFFNHNSYSNIPVAIYSEIQRVAKEYKRFIKQPTPID